MILTLFRSAAHVEVLGNLLLIEEAVVATAHIANSIHSFRHEAPE
jgi:hypothetical protein